MMFKSTRPYELRQLVRLESTGGLAVVHGRRRMGKTGLLLEWAARKGRGIYFVADQSAPDVQREYLAEAVADRLPGFADVRYRDWRSLFQRLATDAAAAKYRGPLVIDELPYLTAAAPELASVLQHFCDQAARGKLAVALAGSDARSMQEVALAPDAPLFGRAAATIELRPLGPEVLAEAFGHAAGNRLLDLVTAWGGSPRYWQLAKALRGSVQDAVDALVLDPHGILHDEPVRLLLEESPSAIELRPILDAIGGGATRVSDIAGRIGRAATSLSRALDRLRELGLIEREIPFGQTERDTKRTHYRLVDPLLRLWFRVVAPNRSKLAAATKKARLALLAEAFPALRQEAWEALCLASISAPHKRPKAFGAWQPARRFWQGSVAAWDLVSESTDGKSLLLGQARVFDKTPTLAQLTAAAQAIAAKTAPALGPGFDSHRAIRVLMVPEVGPRTPPVIDGIRVLTMAGLVPTTS